MEHLPKTTANTQTADSTAEEIKSLKRALGLVLAELPEEKRVKVQQALLNSFDKSDKDLATQLNQFIFHGKE
ncbi:hypothetical protein ACRZOS_002545 [Enterobacter kobei]